MPTVPRYESQVSADVQAQPGLQVQASPEAFGGGVAKGLEALGAGAQDLSQVFEEHALKLQAQDNAAEVDELLMKGMQGINDINYGDDGYYTKLGKRAVDDFQPTKDTLFKLKDELANSASNDAVKKAFDSSFRSQVIFNLQGMSSHYAGERKKYQEETFRGKTAALSQTAALNYANEDLFNATADEARKAFAEHGVANGQPLEMVTADYMAWLGKALGESISMQSFHDPVGAQARLDANRSVIAPEAQVALERSLQTPLDLIDAGKILDSTKLGAIGGGAYTAPFANGTAAADAITKAIPGTIVTGIGPAKSAAGKAARVDNTYHNLPGSQAVDLVNPNMSLDQLAQQVKQQYGNSVKVLVEGPGAPHSTSPHVHVQWEKTASAPPNASPLDIRVDGEKYVDNAVAQAKQARPGDPQFWNLVESKAKQEVAEARQEAQLREQTALQTWTTEIVTAELDGRKPDVQAMLKTPALSAAFNSVDPQTQKKMIAMARAAASGPQQITQEMIDHYKYLNGLIQADPKSFMALKLADDGLLTNAWRNKLVGQQIKLGIGKNPDDINSPLNHAIGLRDIKTAMQQMKIYPDPKNKVQQKKYAQFLGEYQSMIETHIQVTGKKPTDADLRHMFNQLATIPNKTQAFGRYWSWEHKGETQVIPGVENHRAQAIADYLRDNNVDATPENIQFYNTKHPGAIGQ